MKITAVSINRRKRSLEIKTRTGNFSLPWNRLSLKPSAKVTLVSAEIDNETGRESLLLRYSNGAIDGIHVDAFLDYNRDPNFLRDLALYQMSAHALEAMKSCGLSKHEVMRRMQTSPSQLYRLLDPTNYNKTVDQMLKLLSVLGSHVQWKFERHKLAA